MQTWRYSNDTFQLRRVGSYSKCNSATHIKKKLILGCFALKKKSLGALETSVNIYYSTQNNTARNFSNHYCCGNLKSRVIYAYISISDYHIEKFASKRCFNDVLHVSARRSHSY